MALVPSGSTAPLSILNPAGVGIVERQTNSTYYYRQGDHFGSTSTALCTLLTLLTGYQHEIALSPLPAAGELVHYF